MSEHAPTTGFDFNHAVLAWFKQHGRKQLPWQENPTPYRVWVSEIMLQQTQVATVIPYYLRFMQAFPEIKTLALAGEDQVLHYWTGLGYYARARNLHKAAKIIHQEYQGKFPEAIETVSALPGIGRSTAGAIIALAWNKKATILDGNVKRVLSRFHCIEGWPEQSGTQRQLWQIAEQYTPARQCRDYTQAMMDLGATLCTRSSPQCSICPLRTHCEAYLNARTHEFPQKKPKKSLPVRTTQMLILCSEDRNKVLLEKRPSPGIWGGLWAFPELDSAEDGEKFIHAKGFRALQDCRDWDALRHTFSHFHLDIQPRQYFLRNMPVFVMENPGWHWYDLKKPSELGLAAPVKKILQKLEQEL